MKSIEPEGICQKHLPRNKILGERGLTTSVLQLLEFGSSLSPLPTVKTLTSVKGDHCNN